MKTGKTPMVQRLILGVLTLILICLVVLIAQNRSRPVAPAESAALVESIDPQMEIPQEPSNQESPRKLAPAPIPRAVSEQPRTAPSALPPSAQPEPPPGIPAEQHPYVTLVSPVHPQSLDIVV